MVGPQPGQTQAPQAGAGGLPPQLLQMLDQVLAQLPKKQPAGFRKSSYMAPGFAQVPTPEQQVMDMFVSMLQSSQPARNGMNAMQGQQGAMFGNLGGRPRGS